MVEADAAPAFIRPGYVRKRVLITGVTGFLAMALFERILGDLPDTRIVLLVRGSRGTPPQARVEQLLDGNAFRVLRERLGAQELRRLVAERVEVLEGDITSRVPDLPDDIDVVFHCAATVSFDPPIDEGFETNLLGTVRLYEAIARSGSRPHLVHVSTAYVAGFAKGIVPEATLDHDVDWRAEADAALSARREVEAASRKPEMLDAFVRRSRHEHGRAGPEAMAAAAEERRREWVHKRLVQYGRARSNTLGWPDLYTLTKALGERAVEDLRGDLPLSIVRPSIIESALEHPYPGWIEGFKMAEPIILAYGRGAIPEFPGAPDVVVDVIPVDLVVNAMLAVGVTVPDGRPAYYHVSSGSRNPLSYRRLYELVREYFQRHPLPDRGRGHHDVPVWRWPGRRRVESRLRQAEKLLDVVERLVERLPRSNRVRELVRQVDRGRGRLDFVRRYADLYGAYTETEVIYTDHRVVALWERLPADDRRDFPFDAAVVDWSHYLKDVHCPQITQVLRFVTPERPKPTVAIRPSDDDAVLAVFDMEGTLLDSNVVESYLWLRMAELPLEDWPAEIASVASKLPRYIGADRRDRAEFLRTFYRRYRGAAVDGVARLVDEQVSELILRRVSAAAIRRIREHRAAGHRTVLITGALESFARPLAPLFDEVQATRLARSDGRYTGDLALPPIVGEARTAWLRAYADATGGDLKRSYAYADSHSDLPVLVAVGNPVAVNPDVALYREARRRRWPIEDWRRSKGTPRVLLPDRVPPARVR